jgi:hypothetical protein
MKKLLPIFVLFLFGTFQLKSQNTMFLENSEEKSSKVDLSKIVPKEITDFFDPNIFYKTSFNDFVRMHIDLEFISFPYSFLSINGIYSSFINSETEDYDYEASFEKLKKLVFSNKSFYETAYNAAMPLYKDAFSKMTNAETEGYLSMIESAIKFTETFDLNKELADEAKEDFYYAQEKGKICAFVFRRIKNEELTKEECLYWLNKIYKDLKSAEVKKSNNDDYILVEKIFGNYYKAEKFDNRLIEKIFIEESGQYKVLSENATIKNYYLNYMHYFYVQYKLGENQYQLELYNPSDELNLPFVFKTEKEVYELEKTDNWLQIVFDDRSIKILNTEYPEIEKTINKTLKNKILKVGNYSVFNYTDNSAELIEFGEEYFLFNQEFNHEILDFKNLSQAGHFILKTADKKNIYSFLENGKRRSINLPSKYEYYNLTPWRNYLLFQCPKEDKQSEEDLINEVFPESSYGVIIEEVIISEPVFKGFKIISENADIILMQEQTKSGDFYAIFDKDFKRKSNAEYLLESKLFVDPETMEEEYVELFVADTKDKTFFLKKIGKNQNAKALLIDMQGKVIIPPNWPYLERIYTKKEANNLYKACTKVTVDGDKINYGGKWALFDHKGKQLTKFIYDFIGNPDEEGLLYCTRNNSKDKYLAIDKNGIEFEGELKFFEVDGDFSEKIEYHKATKK